LLVYTYTQVHLIDSNPQKLCLTHKHHQKEKMEAKNYSLVGQGDMESVVQTFLEELAEPVSEGWTVSVEKKQLTVARKRTPGTDVYRLRMVGLINFPLHVVDTVLNNVPIRLQWDKGITLIETLETLPNGLQVVYMSISCPPGISDRDFLHIRIENVESADNQIHRKIVLDKSVIHPGKPLIKNYIRANTILGGLLLQKKQLQGEGGKIIEGTEYSAITQVDVCGDLPKLILNALASKATAEWFSNLEKACAAFVSGKLTGKKT